jgi:hypothetical protein
MAAVSFEGTPNWTKCQRPFTSTPAFSSAPNGRVFFSELNGNGQFEISF